MGDLFIIKLTLVLASALSAVLCEQTNLIDRQGKIKNYAEPGWFLENIPFIDIPDQDIEDVYYYRWSSHKRHLRYTLPGSGYSVTEFIHKVFYAGKFDTINAAAGHHIFESRWLRNRQYNQDYINFWTRDTGLAHAYSEWIAAAAYENYLIDLDEEYVKSQLPGFVRNFNQWQSNFNPEVGLYFLSPHDDAMEYSCSSLPTDDDYHGGVGYRPSFNSEMYANALAIAQIARLNGSLSLAADFENQAAALRANILKQLWDADRKFFYHMMRDDNPNLELLGSREEIGFFPWRWGVPDNTTDHAGAWEQLLDPLGFGTQYGPTTCEVRSQYYDGEQESQCCWWNGNSWPYSTGFTLNSLAALIQDYQATFVTVQDYLDLLRKYALTQFKNDKPYVAECHSPERKLWVCDSYNHSEHYAHSTYTDNVLAELMGIQPQPDDSLAIHPLIPNNWRYFAVENLLYHGHEVSVVHDADGSHYETGNSGLQVYVNGQLVGSRSGIGPISVKMPPAIVSPSRARNKVENIAANAESVGYPRPTVSFNGPSSSPWQAIDGRVFYDFLPSNRWSNFGSGNPTDWFAIDFGPGRRRTFNSVKVYVYSDVVTGEGGVDCPTSITVQYLVVGNWTNVENVEYNPPKCSPNDVNVITFNPVTAQEVRLVFGRDLVNDYYVGISEVEIWTRWPQVDALDTYEAEDGLIFGSEIQASDQASSGAYVGGPSDSDDSYVEFSGVWADRSGEYSMRVYYANGGESVATQNVLVNNDYTLVASYSPTSVWGVFNNFITIPVQLRRGNNVIIFFHGSNRAQLDKIQIS